MNPNIDEIYLQVILAGMDIPLPELVKIWFEK